VYTKTDRVGTYCLVDMELWLDLLGIKPKAEKSADSVDKIDLMAYNGNEDKTGKDNSFDVVFMVDQVNYSDEQLVMIKDKITETSAAIWKRTPDATVVIYGYNGDGITHFTRYGRAGSENPEALNVMLNRLVHLSGVETVIVSKAIDDLISESEITNRKTYAFMFLDAVYDYTEISPRNSFGVLNKIENGEYDVNISVVSNVPLEDTSDDEKNKCYAIRLYEKTGGISIDAIDFVEKALKHIYGEKNNQLGAYNAIIATGYHTVVLDAPITSGYRDAAEDVRVNPQNLERYRRSGMVDTDKDGLLDFQEINFEIYGKEGFLVQFDEEGYLKELPLATVCSDLYINTKGKDGAKPLTYVEKGWKAFENSIYYKDLSEIHILPINSDPTNEDGDGVSDARENEIKDKNPLILDNVRILYNDKYTTEYDVDIYLEKVYKTAGGEDLVKYLMEDYFDTDSKIDVNTISDEWWYIYCSRFNKYVQQAYPYYSNLITQSTPQRLVPIPSEVHYFRNNLNRAPATLGALIEENKEKHNWILLSVSESVFHMYGDGGEYNVKFVSNDGYQMFEAVYSCNYENYSDSPLIDCKSDIHNCATYNFTGPKDVVSHAFYDVTPYFLYYTVPDVYNPYLKDLQTIGFLFDRNLGCSLTYAGYKYLTGDLSKFGAEENLYKYNNNSDAKEKRDNLITYIPIDCIKSEKD